MLGRSGPAFEVVVELFLEHCKTTKETVAKATARISLFILRIVMGNFPLEKRPDTRISILGEADPPSRTLLLSVLHIPSKTIQWQADSLSTFGRYHQTTLTDLYRVPAFGTSDGGILKDAVHKVLNHPDMQLTWVPSNSRTALG